MCTLLLPPGVNPITVNKYIIIIIIIPVITFVLCVYNYITETNHVSMMYSIAGIPYVQSVLHVMLFYYMFPVVIHIFRCSNVPRTTTWFPW